jgi:histidinol phosphatase-like enzyme
MIGDALSDFEAAHNTGIFYYPILVHDEVASWGMFKDFYLEKFITEAYPQFQDALIKMFDYNLANKLATTAVLI